MVRLTDAVMEAGEAAPKRKRIRLWVPPEARWAQLQAEAKQPTIGKAVETAHVVDELIALAREMKAATALPEHASGYRAT